MTGRSFVVSMLTVAIVAAIAGRCTAPSPKPLPAKTQARVTRHVIQTAIDSTEIRRLKRIADQARADQQEQTARAARAEGKAAESGRTADSLKLAASAAATLADSARLLDAAYTARTTEADSLRSANAGLHHSLNSALQLAAATDSALSIRTGQASRSDSLIAELLPLAMQREPCRILYVLNCPSRKQIIVGAAVATVSAATVGYLVGKGTIKVKVALPFR